MSKFFDLHTLESAVNAPASLAVIFASSVVIPTNPNRKKLILKNVGSGVVLINVGAAPVTANNLYELAVDEEMTLEAPGIANEFNVRTKVVATTATLYYKDVL